MGLLDTLLGRSKPVRANLDNLFALPGAAVTLQVSAGLLPTKKAGVCFKPPAGQPFAEMQAQIEQLLRTPDSDDSASAGTAAAPPGPAAAASGSGTPSSSGEGALAKPAPTNLTVRHVADSFGYRWIIVEGGEIDDLVTRVHMVHSSIEEGGWSTQLLCSVFGFAPGPSGGAGSDIDSLGVPAGIDEATSATTGSSDSSAASDGIGALTEPVYLVYLAKRGTFYPFAPTGKETRDTELELRLKSILASDLPVESDLSNWFPIWELPIA